MSAPKIHATDGGMFGHALCEEPTGDTARDSDATCQDCLDLLEDIAEYVDEWRATCTANGMRYRRGDAIRFAKDARPDLFGLEPRRG